MPLWSISRRGLKGRDWNPSSWILQTEVSPTGLLEDLTPLLVWEQKKKIKLAAGGSLNESEKLVLESCAQRTPAEVHWWLCWPSEWENIDQTEI